MAPTLVPYRLRVLSNLKPHPPVNVLGSSFGELKNLHGATEFAGELFIRQILLVMGDYSIRAPAAFHGTTA
jgi:hypothetical protein